MNAVTFAHSLPRALSTPLALHPASIAVGALGCGILFLTMSQGGLQASMPLRVEYMPHPRDVFRIEEGTQYTVPTGKVFVLMGLGNRLSGTGGVTVQLQANGVTEQMTGANGSYWEAPKGSTYGPGTLLAVDDGHPANVDSYATGYLVVQ